MPVIVVTRLRLIITGGQAATFTQPSTANATLAFPPPAGAPSGG